MADNHADKFFDWIFRIILITGGLKLMVTGTVAARGHPAHGDGYRVIGLAMLAIGLVWTYRHMRKK